jgi:hypothetical protein
MDNAKAGLAAVETGALLNRTATDIYLAGASAAAHRSMSRMAAVLGDSGAAAQTKERYEKAAASLNGKFWNPQSRLLSFALTEGGGRSGEITIWPAVAMALDTVRPAYASEMLNHLAGSSISTDWGGRMLAKISGVYDPVSYNNGSVWPFLSGILGWAEYRHHRQVSGFTHWVQNSRLTYIHSLGRLPELLSGDFYQPLDTAVPHQLFSSAAVITPLVKGMLGFYPAHPEKRIRLAPHMPVRWREAQLSNLRVGDGAMTLGYVRSPQEAVYRIRSRGLSGFQLDFAPALEPGALLRTVTVNGTIVKCEPLFEGDVHCPVSLPLTGDDEVRIEFAPGLRVLEPMTSPTPGDRSSTLKVVNIQWDRTAERYTLDLEGLSGRRYGLEVRLPRRPAQIEGASWNGGETEGVLAVDFPADAAEYSALRVRVSMK